MKHFFIISFFILLRLSGFAQNNFDNPDLVPKPQTPETAQLGKYVSLPVGLNTGTPQISIPIYTIEYGGIQVPITLSYDAGGIKVEDLASSVGLKWSLNFGGSVSRIVRGTYDEGNHYSVTQNGMIQTGGYYQSYGLSDLDTLASMNPNDAGQIIGSYFQDVATGQLDTQPDLFAFNGLGSTGKFFFDENRKPILHDANDYIIQETYSTLPRPRFTRWIVTSPNGLKMTFGNQESAIEKSCSTNFGINPTNWQDNAWYISRIDNPLTNKAITFEYVQNEYRSAIVSSRTFQYCFTFNGNSTGLQGCPYSDGSLAVYDKAMEQFINTSSGESKVRTQLNYQSPIIKKIIAGDIEVIFNTSNRIDVFNIGSTPQKIDEIIVKYKGSCIKKFNLNQNYFISGIEPIETNIYGDTTDPSSKKRLKLVSLDEISCTTGEKKTHKFFYNETHALPPRLSFARDKWGYYNGKNNNGSLYPEKYEPFNKSGDRRVYPEYTKTGTLNKIVYPTKGSIDFDYEVHKSDTRTFSKKDWKNVTTMGTGSSAPADETTVVFESTFLMTDSPAKYRLRAALTKNTWEYSNTDCSAFVGTAYELIDPVTNQVKFTYGYSAVDGQNDNNNGRLTIIENLENLTQNKTYKIKVYGYAGHGNASLCYMSSLYIEKFETVPPLESDYYVGGLRVKQINFKDIDGTLIKSNSYQYQESTLLYNPKFQYHFNYDVSDSFHGFSQDNAFGGSSGLAQAIADFRRFYKSGKFFLFTVSEPFTLDFTGSHIAYNQVTEIMSEGKTQYNYMPPKTYLEASGYTEYDIFPPKPLIQNSTAGKLLSENYFDKNDVLLKYKLYNYKITFGDFVSRAYQISGANIAFPKVNYNIRPDWVRLESETTKNYFNGAEVNTQTHYFYESDKHHMPTKTVVSESNSDEIITKNQYPSDLFSSSHLLNQQNRVATPVKTQNYIKKNGGTIEALQATQLVKYSATSETSSLTLPTSVETSKGDDPLEEQVRYEKYDNSGNLLQYKKANGTSISYIWGYHKQHPIAKLENVAYADITSYVSDLQTLSDADNDRTQGYLGKEGALRQALDDLRDDLPNAMITTYTYDPLIGVTSITDPKGETIYYKYDDFNRLQYVLDQDDYVAQQMRYNYEGQGSDVLSGVTITRSTSGTITPNQEVTFTAGTTGSGTNMLYTWSVNGVEEQCDTATSFSTSFPSEGSYRVSVLAYDAQTKQSTDSVMTISTVYAGLTTPSLYESHDHITYGTMVDYSVSGIGGGSGSYRYEWYVNDVKQSAVGTSFQYTSYTTGSYRIQFKVIDKVTGKSSISSASRLGVYAELGIPSLATSVSSSYIFTGTSVTFTGGSITGGSNDLEYEWYVNGQKQSEDRLVLERTFGTSGDYTIKFRVIDDNISGHYKEKSVTIYVNPPLSRPSISANKTHIVKGTAVTFTASNVGGGSGSRRYEWYINDAKQSATGTSFTKTFSSTGTYTIKFKVVDNTIPSYALWSSNTRTVFSHNDLTTPSLSSNHTHFIKGTTVTFTAGNISGGSGSRYEWYINNVKQSNTGATLAQPFNSTGSYTVKFRVIDNSIPSYYKERSVTVKSYNALNTPSLSKSNTYFLKGGTITFTAGNIGNGSGSRRYEWYINNVKQSYAGTKLVQPFNSTGTYTVKFRVVDNNIPSHFKERSVTVYSYNPLNTPSISANKTHIVKGTEVTFTASGIGNGSGYRRYEWYVNNVKQSYTGTTYKNSFPTKGTYNVKFRVIDTRISPTHYKESNTRTVYSHTALNTPSLAKNHTYVLNGTTITFTAGSIGNGSGNRRYEWYVNNVKQSYTGTQLSYKVNSQATYTVKFRVVDNNIPSHFKERSVTVYSYNPLNTPSISANKTHIVKGTEVTFTASGIGNGSGYRRYEWYVNNVKQSYTGTTYKNSFPTKGTYTVKFRVIDTRITPATHYKESNTRTVYSYNPMRVTATPSSGVMSNGVWSIRFGTRPTGGSGNYTRSKWVIWRKSNPSWRRTLNTTASTYNFMSNDNGDFELSVDFTDTRTTQVYKLKIPIIVNRSSGGGGGGDGDPDPDCPNCGDQW